MLVANYRCAAGAAGVDGQAGAGLGRRRPRRRAASAAPDDVVGNIAVRLDEPPPGRALRRATSATTTRTPRRFRDGWYYTGDKAWRDGDGYLWFEGRDDDVITSSAYRIGPFEVESALVEHPAVVEAAVVGSDDPERTQIVCAFVVLAAGLRAAATSSPPSCRPTPAS